MFTKEYLIDNCLNVSIVALFISFIHIKTKLLFDSFSCASALNSFQVVVAVVENKGQLIYCYYTMVLFSFGTEVMPLFISKLSK